MNQNSLNNLITDWAAGNTDKLLTRITLKNGRVATPYAFADGEYDCLIIKAPGVTGYQTLAVAKDKSPLYKLDEKELTQVEMENLDAQTLAKIRHIGTDPGSTMMQTEGEKGVNGKIYMSTGMSSTFGGIVAKRLR